MEPQAVLEALPEIITQLLAFLIVFWILKKYAFGAILGLMDERRKVIAEQFREIDRKKSELERLEKEYRFKIQNIEQEARVRIQEAIQEGSRIAHEIREKARTDALGQLERARADIEEELAKARAVLKDQLVGISTRMAEKIIRKHLKPEDDEAFVKELLKEVEEV